jgi:rhodanese-related sulfurtransferase
LKNNLLWIAVLAVAAIFFIYKFFLSGSSEFNVEPAKFEELTKEKDVVVLDVRSAFEFKGEKIAGAQHISYSAADFRDRVASLDKSKTYLVYCATGSRSAGACNYLKSQGFTNIHNLKGGIEHWKSSGMPVVR